MSQVGKRKRQQGRGQGQVDDDKRRQRSSLFGLDRDAQKFRFQFHPKWLAVPNTTVGSALFLSLFFSHFLVGLPFKLPSWGMTLELTIFKLLACCFHLMQETFKVRLQKHHELTEPLLDYYKNRNILVSLSGNTSDEIYPQIRELLQTRFKPEESSSEVEGQGQA
jgi:hypothetical protein